MSLRCEPELVSPSDDPRPIIHDTGLRDEPGPCLVPKRIFRGWNLRGVLVPNGEGCGITGLVAGRRLLGVAPMRYESSFGFDRGRSSVSGRPSAAVGSGSQSGA